MGKEIEVIFIEEQKGQFKLGQRKRVKVGYARNFLLPQKYAVLATKENETKINSILKKAETQQKELKKIAEKLKSDIDKKTIHFKVKSHDEGKLYGSISITDIAEKINADFKTSIDKYDLKQLPAIKEIGEYKIPVLIHNDIQIEVTVNVESENKEKEKKAEKIKKAEKSEEAKKDSTEQ